MTSDEKYSREDRYKTLLSFDEVLGLDLAGVKEFTISSEAKELLEKMKEAREQKNYELSDSIRNELELLGYKVEQSSQGVSLSPIL